jgi:hypothetical protein
MLARHERNLVAVRDHNETAGQIASREMKVVKIKGGAAEGRGVQHVTLA